MDTFRRADAPISPSAAGRQGDSAQSLPGDGDVSVREALTAGGLRGLTVADMFPGVTA
ncbi:hypothetical protein [Microbacterium sp. CSI-V]|uniref:hypothetical protein n=1 Tax=Microbacterium sp. CSI-V TaxID=1933777 RepID=UPI00158C008C|nr:hypothetical protein [Microbacterium sp. CSI-V]